MLLHRCLEMLNEFDVAMTPGRAPLKTGDSRKEISERLPGRTFATFELLKDRVCIDLQRDAVNNVWTLNRSTLPV